MGLFFCHTGIEFVKQQCADDTDYGKDEVYNDCASACVSDGKKFTFKRREKGGGHNDADDRMEHDGVMMLEHVIDAADKRIKVTTAPMATGIRTEKSRFPIPSTKGW